MKVNNNYLQQNGKHSITYYSFLIFLLLPIFIFHKVCISRNTTSINCNRLETFPDMKIKN